VRALGVVPCDEPRGPCLQLPWCPQHGQPQLLPAGAAISLGPTQHLRMVAPERSTSPIVGSAGLRFAGTLAEIHLGKCPLLLVAGSRQQASALAEGSTHPVDSA